ncbi:MAG: O-antigen ligase family protein [Elusimicrobia bacterium]|nr:O-antigen ligase family protein [Elusimicrobiota bacterium]
MVGEALLIAAAVFGPLAHGCVEPWSVAALEIILLSMLLRVDSLCGSPPQPAAVFLIAPASVIVVLGFLQWLNPAPVDGPSSRLPFTASSYGTGKALVLWAAFVALFLRAPGALSRPGAKARLAWTLVLVGAFVTAVGLIQAKAGNKFVYGLREARYGRAIFGPYFHAGHAASLLAMILPVGLGLLASRQAGKWRHVSRGMLPSDFLASQATLSLLVACSAVGVLWTRNRGAVLGLVMSAFAAGFWACGFLRSKRLAAALKLGLAAAPAALVASILLDPGIIGFAPGASHNSITWRLGMYRGALSLLSDFPLWGVGLGAVAGAFPPYKDPVVQGVVDHVHSDWLELPLESGVLGLSAWVIGLSLLARWFWLRSRDRKPEELFLDAGAVAGALAFTAQAAVEFSFHTPANAVVFLSLLCWLAGGPASEDDGGSERARHRHERPGITPGRWALTAAALALMARAAVPVVGDCYALRAKGLPALAQIPLLRRSYRWNPDPQTAYSVGHFYMSSAHGHPRGRAAGLREGLAFVRKALAADPLNPYLTRLQGRLLAALGRRQDAEPMLAVPR